ncbi:MAG: hypothetical protein Q4F66_10345 [Clostridium sp.]|nr:hypothetical protein [Clostridium sp.]
MSDLKKHYKMDMDSCIEMARGINIARNFEAKSLVQFSVKLPIYLPFRDGSITSRIIDKKSSVAIALFRERDGEEKLISSNMDNIPTIKKIHTVVEMIYVTTDKNVTNKNRLNKILDQCIEKLNEFIVAVMVKTKNNTLHRVNTRALEPICFSRSLNLCNIEKGFNDSAFIFGHNAYHEEELLSDADFSQLVSFTNNVVSKNLNPFVNSDELMISAFRNKNNGLLKEAVTLAQTSVESFFRNLYRCLLIKESVSKEEIEKKLKMPFMRMMKEEFTERLGGKWNVNEYGPMRNWYEESYQLRNSIIHAGTTPTVEQTERALRKSEEFMSFALQRLKQNPELREYMNYYISLK